MHEKICAGTCTFEELENFVRDIDKKEFDLDNAFEKYYSLDRILYVIGKYKAKKINDRFLAYWANAYNWIIMSGFKIAAHKAVDNISIKEIVVDEISDWLDSLSFFESDEDFFDVNHYVEVFSTLDEIYKNLNAWEVGYVPTNEFCEENGDAWILFINASKKAYLKICYEGYGDYTIENQEPWTEDDMDKAIQSLNANGYQEMSLGEWSE